MKIKQFFVLLTGFSILLLASTGHADDFTAVQSGNWSDTNTWTDNSTITNGIVPGATDDVDVPFGINVTVDTNESIGFIYDSGTITMGTNSTLNVFNDTSISPDTTLITTAPGNTVVYICNPYDTKQCNYNNLVLANTNYVDPLPPYSPWEDFNNFSIYGPTPMNIAGNMTLMGAVKVQQGSGGAPITIGGDLIIGAGCAWDCSGDNLTVVSNVYVYGLLEDLNGALGSNNIEGNVIVAGPGTSVPAYAGGPYTNGWYVGDVITWYVGGSLTNDGSIFGDGYGSISFNGTGVITGSNALTIPTMAVNGTYAIDDTITLTTNTPIYTGTLVFDLAQTNQIILRYSPSSSSTNTTITNFYGGNLVVTNSGVQLVSGNIYKFFSASNYSGAFALTSFPSLPAGLSWVNNLATSGSIAVTGTAVGGSPIITSSHYNSATLQFTLTWTSTSGAMYTVQETPSLNPTDWNNLQPNIPSGGTTTTYTVTMPPGDTNGFLRILQQ